MWFWVNDRFVRDSRANVSVYDYGFLYGDGVFETLRVYNGRIFRVGRHLARFRESARGIGLRFPLSTDEFRILLNRTVLKNRLRRGLLRITVTRGAGPWGSGGPPQNDPTVVVMASRFSGYPERAYSLGQKLMISSLRKHGRDCLDPRIKSLNFLGNRLAVIEARDRGFDGALMLNREGDLAEGAFSNLFLVRNQRLITPSPESGILMGITREVVLRAARRLGLAVREKRVSIAEMKTADECFITGTSIEVMPVHHVGSSRIGNGRPGEITRRIHREFRRMVRKECGGEE